MATKSAKKTAVKAPKKAAPKKVKAPTSPVKSVVKKETNLSKVSPVKKEAAKKAATKKVVTKKVAAKKPALTSDSPIKTVPVKKVVEATHAHVESVHTGKKHSLLCNPESMLSTFIWVLFAFVMCYDFYLIDQQTQSAVDTLLNFVIHFIIFGVIFYSMKYILS